MKRFSGKTALVTGASRGIGRGIAQRLGQEGARVAVHYRSNEAAAKETVAAIEEAGGSAFAIAAELGVPGDAEALWAAFDEHADGLDILVNNAAGEPQQKGIGSTTPEGFDEVVGFDMKAPFFIIKHGLERLRDGGRVVNISSAITHSPSDEPDLVVYTMAKSGLDAMTTALAKLLASRGITVNTVAPGFVETDTSARFLADPQMRQYVSSMAALGRIGQPDDIAAAVSFLASDDGRWVTGHWLDASGGTLL